MALPFHMRLNSKSGFETLSFIIISTDTNMLIEYFLCQEF